MSAPASRPVHPCVLSLTSGSSTSSSRGVEFSTWAYLTTSRRSSGMPNLVTASGSTLHVYTPHPDNGRLRLEQTFSDMAGEIIFLEALRPKSATEKDALLLAFAGHNTRLAVVTLGEPAQLEQHQQQQEKPQEASSSSTATRFPLLHAVCLLDLTQIWKDHSYGAVTEEDSVVSIFQSKERPGHCTVGIVLGGGIAVVVTEIVSEVLVVTTEADDPPKLSSHAAAVAKPRFAWRAREPYTIPLKTLSSHLPVAQAMEGGSDAGPQQQHQQQQNLMNNPNESSMKTGWGDMFDIEFLSGFSLDPVLVILHSSPGGRLWTGRMGRENSSGPPALYLTALSISVAHTRTALLWSQPVTTDAQRLVAFEGPHNKNNNKKRAAECGCLVVGVNTLVFATAGGRLEQVLAVNGFARATCPAVLAQQLAPNPLLPLSLQLDSCQICWLVSGTALLSLRRGQIYLLQRRGEQGDWILLPTGQTLSSMGEIAHLSAFPLLSSLSLSSLKGSSKKDDTEVSTGFLMAGSRLGDSFLLGYKLESSKISWSGGQDDQDADAKSPDRPLVPKSEEFLVGSHRTNSNQQTVQEEEIEDVLMQEDEALYAPAEQQQESIPNIIPPSDDEGPMPVSKRRRLARWSVLRAFVPVDRILYTGPLGPSCEGPIGAPPQMASGVDTTLVPGMATETAMGASALIFPIGYGSSGGLGLVSVPGRDDRTILAEEDCIHVEAVYSLPTASLVLLSMSEESSLTCRTKVFRQQFQADGTLEMKEVSLLDSDDSMDGNLDTAFRPPVWSAIDLHRDGRFAMLTTTEQSAYEIAVFQIAKETDHITEKQRWAIKSTPDETLVACSPFLHLPSESRSERLVGIACLWSTSRSSVLIFNQDGGDLIDLPLPDQTDMMASLPDIPEDEDADARKIRLFYESRMLTAVDLFRAPKRFFSKFSTTDSNDVDSPTVLSQYDEAEEELYGPTSRPDDTANGGNDEVRNEEEQDTTESIFYAVCRQCGSMEIYECDTATGLKFCAAYEACDRGLLKLVPHPSGFSPPLPRSHMVKIDEIRFFEIGPTSEDQKEQRSSHLRSLCLGLEVSSGDFFLYKMNQNDDLPSFDRVQLQSLSRGSREQARHRTKLMKRGIIPRDAGKSPFKRMSLHRFTGISNQDGLFAAVSQPRWIIGERGTPTTLLHRTRHGAPAGGRARPVAGFASPVVGSGYMTLHERVGRVGTQRLTAFRGISPALSNLGLVPGAGLLMEKIPLGVTVRHIQFIDQGSSSADHPLYALLVSREIELDQSDLNDDGMTPEEREQAEREKEEARIQRQVEADLGGFDVEQEWVEEIIREDVFKVRLDLGGAPPIVKEYHALWIVDAANKWQVIDSFDLDEYEQGLTLKIMGLTEFQAEPGTAASAISEEDTSTRDFVTVGTGMLNHDGEDVSSKGRVLLFEVTRVDRSMRRLTSQIANLRLVYQKEIFHGPVTNLSCLSTEGKNRLTIGAGADVNVEQWGNGKLTQVGFFRATMQILDILLFKNFFLLSDAYDSLYFLVWRESDKSLTLLAKDYDPIAIYAAGIMNRGAAMTFLCHDDRQNLQFFQYAPGEAAARGGNKLVCRADCHLGTQTTAFRSHYCRSSLLVHSATPLSTVAATKQQDPNHGRSDDDQRIGAHFGTTDGGIGSIVPLSEPVYWRMAALQSVLANALESHCSLSGRAWRLYRRSPRRGGCRSNDRKKGVIDGDLVLKYIELPLNEQEDLASAIGSTVDLILDNLLELNCSSVML